MGRAVRRAKGPAYPARMGWGEGQQRLARTGLTWDWAELTELPARSGDWDYGRCDGVGTWTLDREGRNDLYAEDDPDAGELWILARD